MWTCFSLMHIETKKVKIWPLFFTELLCFSNLMFTVGSRAWWRHRAMRGKLDLCDIDACSFSWQKCHTRHGHAFSEGRSRLPAKTWHYGAQKLCAHIKFRSIFGRQFVFCFKNSLFLEIGIRFVLCEQFSATFFAFTCLIQSYQFMEV